ncbi:hypothetical protein [Enterococcus alishanensis]
MNQLSIIEQAVLELIPIGGERKINIADITTIVDLNSREVYSVIQSLRSKGVPIVATRGKEGGIFVATNESERLQGLHPLRMQHITTEETIRNIEQADLDNWKKLLA